MMVIRFTLGPPNAARLIVAFAEMFPRSFTPFPGSREGQKHMVEKVKKLLRSGEARTGKRVNFNGGGEAHGFLGLHSGMWPAGVEALNQL